MARVLTIFVFFCFIITPSFASEIHRNYKGTVTDSATGLPLRDVTVSFYKASDTSLVNFCFTTPNGNYSMELHIKDSILIIVSMMGYKDKVEKAKEIMWDWNFDERDFKIAKQPHSLKEVTISAGLIRMKGDTIEINAARLKVLPNSDVSQMFKKIPGFEVNKNGTIKVNGGEVSKIMVDGSDFFGSNPGLVSKNLRADMIDKVQVYDDKDDNGNLVPDYTKTINLKLKKGKRIGMFGDAVAGYGTNDRYESGLRLNSFKNDRKWSLIANGNNTNDNGFDFGFNNWHGGSWAQRSGSLSRYVYYSSKNDESNSRGNINQKSDVQFSYFNEFSKKRKLSFNSGFNHNDYFTTRKTSSENPINDSLKQVSKSNQITKGNVKEFSADVNYSKETDSVGNWGLGLNAGYNQYTQNYSSTDSIKNNDFIVNNGTNKSLKNIDQQTAGFYFNYWRKSRKNKKRTLVIKEKSNFNNNVITTFQFSRGTNSDFNFKNDNEVYGSEHLLQLNAGLPLYKQLRIVSTIDGYIMNNTNHTIVKNSNDFLLQDFSQSYSSNLDSLSIRFYNNAKQFSAKLFGSISDKDYEFNFGATYLNLTLGNENQVNNFTINKNYNLYLPFVTYGYWRRSFGHARITFEKAVEFPSFNHLMPLQNIANPWSRLVGTPYLLPFEQWQLSGNISKQNFKFLKNIWSNFTVSQSDNYLCYTNAIGVNGISYRTPINLAGYFNENINTDLRIKINKKWDFGCWLSERYTIVPEKFNDQKNFGKNFAFIINPKLIITNSEKLEVDFGVSINYSDYKNNLNKSVNYHQWIPAFEGNARANLWKGSEINAELNIYDKRAIPGIGKIIPIANLYLQQALDKDEKYNLKLTCYDILKQNVTIQRIVNGSFVNSSESNQLQRFFMLSFIYKMKGKNTEGGGAAY
jgi:hypothetical protein